MEYLAAYDETAEYLNGKAGYFLSEKMITSYTQLYSSNITLDKVVEDFSKQVKVSETDMQHDRKSTSSSNDSSSTAFVSSVCPQQDEFQSNLLMNGMEWGNCLYNEEKIWLLSSYILPTNDKKILDGSFAGLLLSKLSEKSIECSG